MKIKSLLFENKISILITKDPRAVEDGADFDMDDAIEDFQRYMEDTWSFDLENHPKGFIAHVDLDDREEHELEDDLYNIAEKFPIDFKRYRA